MAEPLREAAMARPGPLRPRFRTEADLISHFNIRELNSFEVPAPNAVRAARGKSALLASAAADWPTALHRLAARADALNAAADVDDGVRGLATPSRTTLTASSPFGRASPGGTPTRYTPTRNTPNRTPGMTSGLAVSYGSEDPDMAQFQINPYGSFLSPTDTAKILAAAPAPSSGPVPGKSRRGLRTRGGAGGAGAEAGASAGKARPKHAHRPRHRRRGRSGDVRDQQQQPPLPQHGQGADLPSTLAAGSLPRPTDVGPRTPPMPGVSAPADAKHLWESGAPQSAESSLPAREAPGRRKTWRPRRPQQTSTPSDADRAESSRPFADDVRRRTSPRDAASRAGKAAPAGEPMHHGGRRSAHGHGYGPGPGHGRGRGRGRGFRRGQGRGTGGRPSDLAGYGTPASAPPPPPS